MKVLQEAIDFADQNIKELAEEILEWKATSLLRYGKLRHLASILTTRYEIPSCQSLNVAESICNEAFARFVLSVET